MNANGQAQPVTTRVCANPACGKTLERKRGTTGRLETTTEFALRRTCSRECAVKARRGRSGQAPRIAASSRDPGLPPARHDPRGADAFIAQLERETTVSLRIDPERQPWTSSRKTAQP